MSARRRIFPRGCWPHITEREAQPQDRRVDSQRALVASNEASWPRQMTPRIPGELAGLNSNPPWGTLKKSQRAAGGYMLHPVCHPPNGKQVQLCGYKECRAGWLGKENSGTGLGTRKSWNRVRSF